VNKYIDFEEEQLQIFLLSMKTNKQRKILLLGKNPDPSFLLFLENSKKMKKVLCFFYFYVFNKT